MTAQTTERPFWLTGPCPDWCTRDHCAYDYDQGRHHADTGTTIQMTLHPSWGSLYEPQPLHAGLFQGPREVEGYVEIYWPFKDAAMRLTLAEATQLADYINTVAAAARAGGANGG